MLHAVVLPVLCGVVGGVIGATVFRGSPSDILEARSVRIIDPDGRTRIILAADPEVRITLLDPMGQEIAVIGQSSPLNTGGSLGLMGPDGAPRLSLGVYQNLSTIALWDDVGTLLSLDASGRTRGLTTGKELAPHAEIRMRVDGEQRVMLSTRGEQR